MLAQKLDPWRWAPKRRLEYGCWVADGVEGDEVSSTRSPCKPGLLPKTVVLMIPAAAVLRVALSGGDPSALWSGSGSLSPLFIVLKDMVFGLIGKWCICIL